MLRQAQEPGLWTTGSDHGHPLVLVHGIRLSAHMWSAVAARLVPDFRISACDLPGHGALSERPFTLEGVVGQIEAAVAEATRATGHRPVVAGTSLGAISTLAYGAHGSDGAAGLFAHAATIRTDGPVTVPHRTAAVLQRLMGRSAHSGSTGVSCKRNCPSTASGASWRAACPAMCWVRPWRRCRAGTRSPWRGLSTHRSCWRTDSATRSSGSRSGSSWSGCKPSAPRSASSTSRAAPAPAHRAGHVQQGAASCLRGTLGDGFADRGLRSHDMSEWLRPVPSHAPSSKD